MLLELIATLATGLFAGTAIYINVVEHPARLECAAAVQQWRPSYARATVMQASLAIVGLLAALGAWALGRGVPVLVAGLLFGAVVPFRSSSSSRPTSSCSSPRSTMRPRKALLVRWNRLHAVRSGAGLVALVIMLLHLGRIV